MKDFAPVARLPSNPYVIVARKDLPEKDLKELIAWLKANPDKATEGTAEPVPASTSAASISRTSPAPVSVRAVSRRLLRDHARPGVGHIDLTFDQAITALPHVRNGAVKAYAVTSTRGFRRREIPTVDEAGA